MTEAAASQGVSRFPPGTAAPTAADRAARLRDPEHLARLNAGRAAWLAKPEEERQRITAERKAEKAKKLAAKQAKRAVAARSEPPAEDATPTVRSHRLSLPAGESVPPVPDSGIPRGQVAMRGELRGLIDLCGAMPDLGNGSCFIQVTRLKPPMAFNIATAGVQKPIWDVIDDAEFAQAYGGAEYTLRGYALKDGMRAKALTDPVIYRVGGPPNLDSSLTEEDTMRQNPVAPMNNGALRRPGLVTPHAATAEAEMFKERLRHDETMDERAAQRAELRRRREEERQAEHDGRNLDVARLLSEDKEKEMARLQQMQERQLELAQSGNKGGGVAELAEVLKVLRPGEETQSLIRQHSAELRQISESHKEEITRLIDQQRAEQTRLTESHAQAMSRVEDQARLDRERADTLVREAERRATEQIRDIERRSDARALDLQGQARTQYEDLKNRSEERLRDQDKTWQQRFDDLKEAHARELRQKDSEILLMRTNLEGNQGVILSAKDAEIARLKGDLREARDLAEKNKDWLGKMTEFEKTAEKMGFSKGSGEETGDEDVKTTAIKAGLNVLTRLPELVQSAGDAISKVRNPGGNPQLARDQARAGMVRGSMRTMPRTMGQSQPMLQPLTFATEDGAAYTPPAEAAPPRANPIPYAAPEPPPLPALQPSSTHPIMQMPTQQPAMPDPPMAAPAPSYAPPPPTAPPAPSPAPVVAPSAPQRPQQAPGQDDAIVSLVVDQFGPVLAHHFEQRLPPEEVAKMIVQENGVEQARAALGMVTIDQLLRIITTNPAYPGLATRNGQKFLRDIWKHAEQAVA